jgi:hypothetical protein
MLFPAVGFIEEQGRHTLDVHCLPWWQENIDELNILSLQVNVPYQLN